MTKKPDQPTGNLPQSYDAQRAAKEIAAPGLKGTFDIEGGKVAPPTKPLKLPSRTNATIAARPKTPSA